MQQQLALTKINRDAMLKVATYYSVEKLNEIPPGFVNNLIWNIAHVVVTQQLLIYNLAGLPMMVTDELVAAYRKGTKADQICPEATITHIKTLLHSSLIRLEEDCAKGCFKTYKEYTTSTGFVIQNLEDAMTFNTFHEGVHLGYILALKKSL